MAVEAPCRKSENGVVLTPSSSSSPCFITKLPSPILMDILCRVPIKTLMASKSVFKSWLHHITDPQFPQLHQPKAPTEVFFQHLQGSTPKHYMGNFNHSDPLHVKLNTLLEFPTFSVGSKNLLCYNNSCNGLLCYTVEHQKDRSAVVCNPFTSEFVAFPAPDMHEGSRSFRGYGLGFSAKANKFKLLRLRGGKVIGSSEMVVAEICTIDKACSWKIVGKLPVHPPCFPEIVSSGTFLQGTLHWAISRNSSYEICILTFNFEDDQFGIIPLPPHFGETVWKGRVSPCREILGVLGGCLFITDYTREGVNIWLMKEYGVKASWTKLFCFGFMLMKKYCVRDSITKQFNEGLHLERCLPISYMDNGEILMKCTHSISTTVFFYNPVLKSVRVTGFCHASLKVIAYRPSLVLLKDSLLGYDVEVMKSRSAEGETSTTNLWTPVKE